MFVRLDWKKLTNDKHSSLLRDSVIYGQKSFITLRPGAGGGGGGKLTAQDFQVHKAEELIYLSIEILAFK